MKAHHPTQITFVASSTLSATRQLWEEQAQATSADSSGGSSIGVLNFASPKKPGSACLSGGDSHEDRIMRQTTLYDSLQNSAAGAQFYNAHRSESDGSGLHDHAMLYSPGVTVFKDDEGQTIPPYAIHVVSSVPVHAGTVHAKFNIEDAEANEGIRTVMKERMARMLRLFEERENRVLVLGAFGVGQSCNSADMIAEIWADLLAVNNAKFRDVFDKIVFAVPGKHLNAFENAFQGRCLESELLSE